MSAPAIRTLDAEASGSGFLFTPFKLRGLGLENRVVISPMCMYSSVNGFANDFHVAHLGQFALGGAGLILTEATAVSPEGRISPDDLGLWSDEHIPMLARVTDLVHASSGRVGVQLAHAGRKASTYAPWKGRGAIPDDHGAWDVVGPSEQAYSDSYASPRAMTADDIQKVVADFVAATRRAIMAEFDVLEIHAAHGYLLHQFMSPLSNFRTDQYGGPFENRVRLTLEVARAVRAAWPEHLPLFVRLSATDWVEGGWDLAQTVELAKLLRAEGVDLIDVSSGGLSPLQQIEVEPGYQVPFAGQIRAEAVLPTMAVGLVTEARQAEAIVRGEQADLVAIARAALRDPHWAQHAAQTLGGEVKYPPQYERAK